MKFNFSISKLEAILTSNFGYNCLDKYIRDMDLSFISPMQRRRLSPSARKIFFCLKNFDFNNIPIVFSSKKGEANRCFKLLGDLSANELISPTSFSLSVHNAASSQFSIFSKNSCELSAISSQNSLEYGLLEGYLKLQEGAKKVIIVSHFESTNQDFLSEKNSYVLVIMIERGNLYQIEQIANTSKATTEHSSIEFLQHFQCLDNQWQIKDKNSLWQWKYEKN